MSAGPPSLPVMSSERFELPTPIALWRLLHQWRRKHLVEPTDRVAVLSHVAEDRAIFARGAVRAARWLVGRPAGRYTIDEVLGL